ncbi:hypothetical protein H5410_026758, partial [Solanum commersonii]
MTNEGDINAASTSNARSDGGRKHRKERKNLKSSKEFLLDPTLNSDEERSEEPIDVTPGEECITRVDMARQAVEILGKRWNKVDG